jgi:hypothetical protein
MPSSRSYSRSLSSAPPESPREPRLRFRFQIGSGTSFGDKNASGDSDCDRDRDRDRGCVRDRDRDGRCDAEADSSSARGIETSLSACVRTPPLSLFPSNSCSSSISKTLSCLDMGWRAWQRGPGPHRAGSYVKLHGLLFAHPQNLCGSCEKFVGQSTWGQLQKSSLFFIVRWGRCVSGNADWHTTGRRSKAKKKKTPCIRFVGCRQNTRVEELVQLQLYWLQFVRNGQIHGEKYRFGRATPDRTVELAPQQVHWPAGPHCRAVQYIK